jgi:molecular chaperone GrpE
VTAEHEPVEETAQELAQETAQEAAEEFAAPAADPAPEQPDPVVDLERRLAERTLDLQRLQAEYVNYKRRVDRDRDRVRETAGASVLRAMVPVLDDIDRASTHGELTGGFKAVAESLQRVLIGLGLERYGEPGDPFDPRVHEALTHAYDDGVDQPTAQSIMQPGYRMADRIIRPARVAVVEPAAGGGADTDEVDDNAAPEQDADSPQQ